MDRQTSPSQKKDVRNLLFVIFFGVAVAFVGTAWMAYYYGPSGRYFASSVLLSPDVIQQLSYNAYDPKTNGTSRFDFDKIEFSHFNTETKKWQKYNVDLEQYAKFYSLVSSEKSVPHLTDDIINLFNQPYPSRIILSVHTESSAKWQATTKDFQELQFAFNGDYFRVELHEDSTKAEWAYFYHPQIYRQVLSLFTPGIQQ